ncbi:MAG: aminotransferase class I/II-fold pyridoxal phosphate-dependent enzyme [bacterium]|nr:aminotransferase class I/II-fold pyridoxal phosphate-dependent enzyme [bacterium]
MALLSEDLYSKLAILGGDPLFKSPIHVGRPTIRNREQFLIRVNEILNRGWLTNNGPYVQEFERKAADYLDVRNFVAMCNGTTALEIAIRALGMHGEVVVPSFTFVATAHALQWQGIKPVFCDIDPRTHNLDPNEVRRRLSTRTTGIIGVHLWGRPCAIEELSQVALDHNQRLLFDASHAFGSSYRGRRVGGFGDAEVFSFHATKFLNTFEGGAVVTNNDDLAAAMRLMRNFGFSGFDNVVSLGINGKMSEVEAAMGLSNLADIDAVIEQNRDTYCRYRAALTGIPGLEVIAYDDNEDSNFQYVVCEIDSEATGILRDDIVEILHAEGVMARRYFYPGVHRMAPYRAEYSDSSRHLPGTEQLCQRVLCLPGGTAVDATEVDQISEIVRMVLRNGRTISNELRALRHEG